MRIERLFLMGAGGQGKVALDAFRLVHPDAAVEVRDDDVAKEGADFLGLAVRTPIAGFDARGASCHVSIGDNPTRARIALELERAGCGLVTIVHPRGIVAAGARIDRGAFVAAGAVIAPDARVGAGAIVNHLAIVDHDCVVGDWCHIAPGVVLGGEVTIGAGCLLGSGAVVLPGVRIGDAAVIGAGAVVTRDVADGAKLAGIPAKDLNERR
ncbi:MAG TPA: acetyltransferase [Burkholderiales bacterium]|nr:acetyltransferase [Burkholderiales bacterium]